jgi:hypothetical protein
MMGSGREPGKETERYERIRRAKTNIYEASEEERDNAGTVMRKRIPTVAERKRGRPEGGNPFF